LVQAKVRAQAANLSPGTGPRRKLEALARQVRSGDPDNVEAQAARVYWSAWLTDARTAAGEADTVFRRDPDGIGPNALLNYGYAVLRAAVARALVAHGLLPALGLHHSNRSNAFCLADDLLEPLRPLVDRQVRELYWAGQLELDQPTKAALLELLAAEVETAGRTGPLLVALHTYCSSLVACFRGEAAALDVPRRCSSAGTGACGS
jgi:CRISPR-associated protein Cas1